MRTAASLIAMMLGTLVCPPAIAATETYQGSGTYDGNVLQMTLANGETVTGVRVDALATISTSPPALLYGRCMGMGLIPPEGEENRYAAEFYCTFRLNEQDAFDFKGIDKVGGISVEIIGGSGKWAGATGTGTLERIRKEAGKGDFSYELAITTP